MVPDSTPSLQSSNTPILFSDYHSHPQGHRVQRYTQGLLQPWIDSARAKGILDIAASGLVDCLAHLDLVKIHGHRPRAPVTELVEETLELIRAHNLAIELSTAGWRKPVKELYPSDEIIFLAMEKKIPFTIASDAHSWAQLGENYERLRQKITSFGIREMCVYEKHERIVYRL